MSELEQLYNTLSTVLTAGSSTITLANCLLFLQRIIERENKKKDGGEADA